MRINNTPTHSNKNFTSGRNILRTLSNPDSLAATVVLESFVTGGRGANAYARGGTSEFRERFTDDVVSAIFWMKGVDIFNTIGNKFGKHILKLPTTEFDVGKDALRNPFSNLISDLGETCTDPKSLKTLEKKLATFKFSKIIISTILAIGFVGFALPKINYAITRKLMHKEKQESQKTTTNDTLAKSTSFEEFSKLTSKTNNPSFKGLSPQMLTTISHSLEHNKIVKMLSCDTGILTGRVMTARNPDEGLEYFFRDAASSFFYFASTPLMYKLLQKATSSGNLTTIDPVAAKQINDVLIEQLKNADGSFTSMPVKEFAAKTFGLLDDSAKELLDKLPFNSDVISLSELKKYITDENLIKKAAEMAKLQPQQAGVGSVLTKQQVGDVLKNGSINTPEFMQKIFSERFGEDLTNPYKYIPMKKITAFRNNINKYGQSIIDAAKKTNNGIIDKQLLEKLNKKSFMMSGVFRAIAIGVSAFALGYAIPKIQYAITEKRTGQKTAPGLREFEKN